MAVKTFTGSTLSSADINTYCANAGLVYISSTTIGNSVASTVVANCFSSTYYSYRIVVSDAVANVDDYSYLIKLNNSTGNTYSSISNYGDFANTATGTTRYINQNIGLYLGYCSINSTSLAMDLHGPYVAKWTRSQHSAIGHNYGIWGGSIDKNNVSHTGFTLLSDHATPRLTGGTVTVYGVRVA